ncbi:MAG: hypothetical protein ACO1N0_09315 [Fluviicola sp.]
MKKFATLFSVLMLLTSSALYGQIRKETTVRLEWQEQSFIHFYAGKYSVYVSKTDFLNFENELLVGLFDEYSDKNDSISLQDPFNGFKAAHKDLLWNQLIRCASEGKMLVIPNDSKKKLKNIVIIDSDPSQTDALWECRDPRDHVLIFSRHTPGIGNQSF